MYKIIAMDFDDTLLTNDKKITEITKSTLKKYRKKGYIILGVTARSLSSVCEACDIDMFDYLILNNGANIYDVVENKVEYVSRLDKKIANDIYNNLKNDCSAFDFCAFKYFYRIIKKDNTQRECIIDITDTNQISEELVRLNFYLKDNSKLEQVRDMLNNSYSDTHTFIMADSQITLRWLVLAPKGINKVSALKKLCNNLELTTDDVIFFGDGLNDVEIISKVGLGVAMANALDEVKEAAKEVTLSNKEDGIAYYLDKILK